ncbi:GDP-mannose 6-dehydrogenase [Roseibium hamelinense]|uniref:UDP-glucose 6-dehydrogenase n=1 Tax=Roseibium hamelinense TaxID=150831 RepID=A0A562SV79_9HYPH|nr:nucleotide sugar dehydrogenase [Roseibium hamelinense]MTI43061.1 UDP-glucose/GDP-mannose dehydrogenase family protein [Roseibium hamelinense]TWI84636.1 GDP-mannose 6-dehydrogenase [Roseibium hamelinense]
MNVHVGSLLKQTELSSWLDLANLQKSSVSVIGMGYVGAVSLACLSQLGHRVVGADIDQRKVDTIGWGQSPIVEDQLGELLSDGVAYNLLTTTTDVHQAVLETDVTFVSVGTPTNEDGGCDTRAITAVARTIGAAIAEKDTFHVVVLRCSVPPGTTLNLMGPEIEAISGKKAGRDFGLCFNPEFLREGTAVKDFHAPPKTVIGASDLKTAKIISKIYEPVDRNIITTSIEVAELVKYVDNVWHATKVCFANEVGRLCKPMGIDSHAVMDIFVQDTKLNLSPYYLKPGFAFGGSCLPKEVRAVTHLADKLEIDLPMINSLIPSNEEHIDQAIDMVRQTQPKKVAVMGVAFKPGTDDLRESPILEVMDQLIRDGVEVVAWDPAIVPGPQLAEQFNYIRHAAPHLEHLVEKLPEILMDTPEMAADGADTLVIAQKHNTTRDLLEAYRSEASVVDLVRVFASAPSCPKYAGIGW